MINTENGKKNLYHRIRSKIKSETGNLYLMIIMRERKTFSGHKHLYEEIKNDNIFTIYTILRKRF